MNNKSGTSIWLIILVLTVVLTSGMYVMTTKDSKTRHAAPSEEPTKQQPAPGSEWLMYVHEPFSAPTGWDKYPWSGFKLYYPSAWTLDVKKRDVSTAELLVRVSKTDGSYAEVLQGFGDGGRCLFPDEPDYTTFEGAGTKYEQYVHIDKPDLRWRLATHDTPDENVSHSLCEATDGRFSNGNTIGIHKIKLVSTESIEEFTEMLRKLEIVR